MDDQEKWMIRTFGMFIPVLGEMNEMLYQYDRDYIFFYSSKFEKEFDFQPTTYAQGIQKTIEAALNS